MNRQTPKFVVFYLAFAAAAWGQCASPYGFQRAITVNSGQVTGTQTNFPMLVLNPTANLKTIEYGGHVTNSNGYDIIFVDSGGSMLPFQLVGHGTSSTTYSASTGNAEFWVKVGSMAVGSAVYLCHGAASVTTYQGNDSGTWNSNFKLVQHLSNGTALDVSDSTGINTVTNHSITAGAGQVDGAGSGFSGGSNGTYLALGSNAALQTNVFTYSAWVYYNGGIGTIFGSSADAGGPQFRVDPHLTALKKQDMVAFGASTATVTTGVWTHVAFTYDSSGNYAFYLNGVPSGSGTNLQAFTFSGFYLGTRGAGGAALETFNGLIDEPHISNSVRSANWIAAEYKNQSNPGAFYSVGSEGTTSGVLMTSAPAVIPNGHAGNITLTLTGTGTNWSASTVFTLAGVSNVTKVSQNVTSGTAATLVLRTGAGTGPLSIAETVTGVAATAVAVAVPSFTIDMVRGNLNSIQSLTLTGTNTVWSQEAAGFLNVSGGTGVSIGMPAITSNTAGTVALTVGTSAGSLTITDTSTGKTATFVAGAPGGASGCSVVFVQ